jgi:hypothetical protein
LESWSYGNGREILGAQYFAGKILKMRELEGRRSAHFFSCRIPKILVSNNLGHDDRQEPAQNLEPLGLTGKILRNKDLAIATTKAPPPFGWSDDRMPRLWKARSDVTTSERKLWKLGFVSALGKWPAAQYAEKLGSAASG